MLYSIYMWSVIVLAVFFFGNVFLVFSLIIPIARKGPVYKLITSGWGRTIVFLSGINVRLQGREHVSRDLNYIYISNHQSYFDVISLIAFLPHPIRFVAKKELLYLPVFGQALWSGGHVIVDRGKGEKSRRSMEKAARKVSRGTPILVFAEGTRSADHRLGDYKKGGFILAVDSGVPLVPVSVSGTAPIMPKGGYRLKKSEVTITIGEPVPTEGLGRDDIDRLMERVRAAMIRNFPMDSPEYEVNKNDPVLENVSDKADQG